MITRPPERIVARNLDEGGEEGVAHRARCAGKLGEGMVVLAALVLTRRWRRD